MLRYIDIHTHINDPRFDSDVNAVLERMRSASVSGIVVGTDKVMSERALALALAHQDVWATVGQHPTDRHDEVFDPAWYKEVLKHQKVVGIGECGLDYFWPSHDGWTRGEDDEKRRQHDLFLLHLELTQETKKPLMIHGRPTKGTMDAYVDILAQLKAFPDVVGNVHFFVGDTTIAKQFLERGFTMSFTGVLTFTKEYHDTLRYLPMSAIHAETDAPYVAPVPHRGQRNEPAYVVRVVERISEIRGEPLEVIQDALLENAKRTFGV
jgi:TatD DNase family protein